MWYQRLMSYSLSLLLLQWLWLLLLSGLCPYSAMLKVNLIIVRVVVTSILHNKIKSQTTKFVYLLLHSNYSHLWCSRTFYQQHSYHCLLVLILFRWQCMILLHSEKIMNLHISFCLYNMIVLFCIVQSLSKHTIPAQ